MTNINYIKDFDDNYCLWLCFGEDAIYKISIYGYDCFSYRFENYNDPKLYINEKYTKLGRFNNFLEYVNKYY